MNDDEAKALGMKAKALPGLTVNLGPVPPAPETLEDALVAMQGRPINEETIREIRGLVKHYAGEDHPVWWSRGSTHVHIGEITKAALRRLDLTEHEINLNMAYVTAFGRSGGGCVSEMMR